MQQHSKFRVRYGCHSLLADILSEPWPAPQVINCRLINYPDFILASIFLANYQKTACSLLPSVCVTLPWGRRMTIWEMMGRSWRAHTASLHVSPHPHSSRPCLDGWRWSLLIQLSRWLLFSKKTFSSLSSRCRTVQLRTTHLYTIFDLKTKSHMLLLKKQTLHPL